jgi:hypothetical protein
MRLVKPFSESASRTSRSSRFRCHHWTQLKAAHTIQGLQDAEKRYRDVIDAIRGLKDRELAELASQLTTEQAGEEGQHDYR